MQIFGKRLAAVDYMGMLRLKLLTKGVFLLSLSSLFWTTRKLLQSSIRQRNETSMGVSNLAPRHWAVKHSVAIWPIIIFIWELILLNFYLRFIPVSNLPTQRTCHAKSPKKMLSKNLFVFVNPSTLAKDVSINFPFDWSNWQNESPESSDENKLKGNSFYWTPVKQYRLVRRQQRIKV